MRSLSDEDETVMADQPISSVDGSKATHAARPSWMRALQQTVEGLLNILVQDFAASIPEDSQHDALARFFKREIALGKKLLLQVKDDLELLLSCCRSEIKQTNHIRELIDAITKGESMEPV